MSSQQTQVMAGTPEGDPKVPATTNAAPTDGGPEKSKPAAAPQQQVAKATERMPQVWDGIYINGVKINNFIVWTKWDTVIDVNQHKGSIGAAHASVSMSKIPEGSQQLFGDVAITYTDSTGQKQIEVDALDNQVLRRVKIIELKDKDKKK